VVKVVAAVSLELGGKSPPLVFADADEGGSTASSRCGRARCGSTPTAPSCSNAPFGGWTMSGIGVENELASVRGFTSARTVWVELSGRTRDPFRLG
jgi:acyl-CoA reductase-like NAD-dependent aldehyde dehydrogenase